ncbi:MAG TPA: DUF3090 family protein [Acidimicrobiales bacterium]
MSDLDLPELDTITVGSVGPPGARVFYLQAIAGRRIHSLKLEKQQVAALGAAIVEFLADVVVNDPVVLPELVDPGEPDWIVATMALSTLDETTGRVTLVLGELTAEDDDEGAVARLGLTLAQLAALAVRCDAALEGGRPPCPLCGRPLDPEGHVCPKTNGAATH